MLTREQAPKSRVEIYWDTTSNPEDPGWAWTLYIEGDSFADGGMWGWEDRDDRPDAFNARAEAGVSDDVLVYECHADGTLELVDLVA